MGWVREVLETVSRNRVVGEQCSGLGEVRDGLCGMLGNRGGREVSAK